MKKIDEDYIRDNYNLEEHRQSFDRTEALGYLDESDVMDISYKDLGKIIKGNCGTTKLSEVFLTMECNDYYGQREAPELSIFRRFTIPETDDEVIDRLIEREKNKRIVAKEAKTKAANLKKRKAAQTDREKKLYLQLRAKLRAKYETD